MGDKRHVIVLLDIDQTLVRYKKYALNETLEWAGGIDCWIQNMTSLKQEAAEKDIIIHYGIATLKPFSQNAENLLAGLRGDYISGIATSDPKWQCYLNVPVQPGLGALLDEDLCYFVGDYYEAQRVSNASTDELYQTKVKYALEPARLYIEKKFQTAVAKKDVWLIDDQLGIVAACQEEHSAFCVRDLINKPIKTQQSIIRIAFSGVRATFIQVVAEKANIATSPAVTSRDMLPKGLIYLNTENTSHLPEMVTQRLRRTKSLYEFGSFWQTHETISAEANPEAVQAELLPSNSNAMKK